MKDVVFLLSTLNTENGPSNCNIFPPSSSRFPYWFYHHLSRPAYSSLVRRKISTSKTFLLASPRSWKVCTLCILPSDRCAVLKIDCLHSQSAVKLLSASVVLERFFSSNKMEELQNCLRYFNWHACYIPRRSSCLVSCNRYTAMSCLTLSDSLKKGGMVAASMLRKFHSEAWRTWMGQVSFCWISHDRRTRFFVVEALQW